MPTLKNATLIKPLDVLLVEDNPGDIRYTREILKIAKIPVRISVVKNGLEAIAFLCHEGAFSGSPRPDIIFLDLNLPKLNGHELLEKVRHSRELKNVPVVILTSSHASNDTNGSFGSDATFYMTKPIDLQLLSMIPLFG